MSGHHMFGGLPFSGGNAGRYHLDLMPFHIVEFEPTPNPNAVKCWLNRPISDRPRSFLNAEMAREDPIASALFEQAGATTVLFNGDWMTINKKPEAGWTAVKASVSRVLAEAE